MKNNKKSQVTASIIYICITLLFLSNNLAAQTKFPNNNSEFSTTLELPAGIKNVIIDTDTYNEIDDQFALIYALLSPESIKVNAVYAAPFFNNLSSSAGDGMNKSYEEIVRIFDKMKKEHKDLIFKGSNAFMQKPNQPVESDAARDLVKRALEAEGPLYVLALGAPTNIASAILMEPKIIHKIVVVWLGGKGLNWNTASEFNLMQDIYSSQTLFNSGVPLIQIPTEPVTSHLLTNLLEIEHYLGGKNEIGDYLVGIFRNYNNDHFAWSKEIWDISVIAYMINHTWVPTEVRSTPILTNEMTYSFDNSRPLYRVATFIHRNKVFADLFVKIAAYK